MRGNNDLKKSSNLDIDQEKDFQISSKILDPKILGGENYQTFPKNFNSKVLGNETKSLLKILILELQRNDSKLLW